MPQTLCEVRSSERQNSPHRLQHTEFASFVKSLGLCWRWTLHTVGEYCGLLQTLMDLWLSEKWQRRVVPPQPPLTFRRNVFQDLRVCQAKQQSRGNHQEYLQYGDGKLLRNDGELYQITRRHILQDNIPFIVTALRISNATFDTFSHNCIFCSRASLVHNV
jgi:hypothetical protein